MRFHRGLALPSKTLTVAAYVCVVASVVRVFPVGIDVAEFERTLITTPVKERLDELYQRFKGKKVILGVDRLDYIKVRHCSY